MTGPELWQRVEEIYDAALKLDPAERAAFLKTACDEDAELRREVESLLAHREEAGQFLESPAMDMVSAPTMTDDHETMVGRQASGRPRR